MDLRSSIKDADFDVVLVDFDLADGRTGGDAAAWLKARGCPSIFITGQEQLAQTYSEMSAGLIVKPVSTDLLAYALERIRSH